jgi:hypothetical protein
MAPKRVRGLLVVPAAEKMAAHPTQPVQLYLRQQESDDDDKRDLCVLLTGATKSRSSGVFGPALFVLTITVDGTKFFPITGTAVYIAHDNTTVTDPASCLLLNGREYPTHHAHNAGRASFGSSLVHIKSMLTGNYFTLQQVTDTPMVM